MTAIAIALTIANSALIIFNITIVVKLLSALSALASSEIDRTKLTDAIVSNQLTLTEVQKELKNVSDAKTEVEGQRDSLLKAISSVDSKNLPDAINQLHAQLANNGGSSK
jgi:hypothetical protein